MGSRIQKLVGTTAFVLVLAGCGNNPSSSKTPVETQVGPTSFDVKDTWRVTSKTCDGTALASKPHEAYKIDRDHFISIERVSEDEVSLCKIGYVYDRIISSFGATSSDGTSRYDETALLLGSLAKKTCWKKEAGSLVSPPMSDDVVKFGPEEIGFKLVATPDSRSIDLQKVKECPNGTMHLVLVKGTNG